MNPIHYNIKRWHARSKHSKILIRISLCGLAALTIVVVWHLMVSEVPWGIQPWIKVSVLTIADLLFLVSSLSSFSQYSFLYRFFLSEWTRQNSPQDLELVTGTVIHSESMFIPYAGQFKRVKLQLRSGEIQIFYMKRERFTQLDPTAIVRVLTHHLFMVDSYSLSNVKQIS